jgi:type VI secretion system protein ImpG
MLTDSYRRELRALLDRAADFGQDHPALAPWLGAKGSDPDVERLLEGTAYLAALVRRQLAEGFPELAETLLEILYPRMTRPLPAMSLGRFQLAPGFTEPLRAPKGAQLASIPVNSVRARFALTEPLNIWPAQVSRVRPLSRSGGDTYFELTISGPRPLKTWLPESLDLHLAGEYPEACDRRALLLEGVKGLEVTDGTLTRQLPATSLTASGLTPWDDTPGASPDQGYALVREFFAFPAKFLFARLGGLKPFQASGESALTCRVWLSEPPPNPPPLKAEHFLLSVGPLVNLVTRSAHPLSVDHQRDEYLVRPRRDQAERLAIHSIQKVTGVTASGRERPYLPFTGFGGILGSGLTGSGQNEAGYYYLRRREGTESSEGERRLKLVYPQGSGPLEPETLSLELFCHNLDLTDYLRPGDINQPTEKSPAMAVFTNLQAPSRACPPPVAEATMWRVIAHAHLSLAPLASAERLRELLALYLPPQDPDPTRKVDNLRKLQALLELTSETGEAFVRGWPLRGTRLRLLVDGANFAAPGEIRLFGDVLERFLGDFLPLNAFLSLAITEKNTHQRRQWPIRLGTKTIL